MNQLELSRYVFGHGCTEKNYYQNYSSRGLDNNFFLTQGGFPLPCHFYVHRHNFTCVNKAETRSHINVKVEPHSHATSFIISILFTRIKFTSVCTEKLLDSGNPPIVSFIL